MSTTNRNLRLTIVGLVFSGFAVLIFIQLSRIQFGEPAEFLRKQGDAYRGYFLEVYPARGHIYDRWGSLLAANETVYTVGLDLAHVSDAEGIAYALNLVMGEDYDRVLQMAKQEPTDEVRYPIIASYVNYKQVEQLYALQRTLREIGGVAENQPIKSLQGLTFSAQLTRSYPEGSLASNILGFFSRNKEGYYGVEEKYHELLAGQPREIWVSEDPNQVEGLPNIPPGRGPGPDDRSGSAGNAGRSAR